MKEPRRGKNLAIVGAVAQLIFTGAALAIWLWTNRSLSAMATVIVLATGLPAWLMVAVLFYVRQLAEREALEAEELAKRGAERGTIFEGPEGEQLRPAASRQATFEKWVLPIFTLIWAALEVLGGLWLFRYLGDRPAADILRPGQGILLAAVVGFAAFLLSRYATGMGRDPRWRPLRATGSYLLFCALCIAGVIASLVAAWQGYAQVDRIVAYVVSLLLFVLAVELVLNFIFDMYRPRVPGRQRHLSLDSRLLGLIAEPERVGHSIAETVNYQFGFEVSRTWFYQLISRAFLPLIVFAVLVMFAMTSIVIVDEGERYVVSHWGKIDADRGILAPGMHLKWPWPIDKARRFDFERVKETQLGVGGPREFDPEANVSLDEDIYLWTEEHGPRKELNFIIAVAPQVQPHVATGRDRPPPPVQIIKLTATVQYEIDEDALLAYGYNYTAPDTLIQNVAYREMTRYLASATLTDPIPGSDADRPEAIMTYGREDAAGRLHRRIQDRVDELDLGVTVTYVGFSAVHPPASVAPAYQAVLEAEREALQMRYEAEADANRRLAQVAGDPLTALRLDLAIRIVEDLEALRERPSRRAELLEATIRQIEEQLESLRQEIAQERLMGQAGETQGLSRRQQLLSSYREYMELLRSIQSDPEAAEYAERIADARATVRGLFSRTAGEPARIVAEAQAYQIRQELTEAGRAAAFQREMEAYRAAPNIYVFDRWMDVWDEVLPNVIKYVMAVDPEKVELRLNWEQQPEIMGGAFSEPDQ